MSILVKRTLSRAPRADGWVSTRAQELQVSSASTSPLGTRFLRNLFPSVGTLSTSITRVTGYQCRSHKARKCKFPGKVLVNENDYSLNTF